MGIKTRKCVCGSDTEAKQVALSGYIAVCPHCDTNCKLADCPKCKKLNRKNAE